MSLALPERQLTKLYVDRLKPVLADVIESNMQRSGTGSYSVVRMTTNGENIEVSLGLGTLAMVVDPRSITKMPEPRMAPSELAERYQLRAQEALRKIFAKGLSHIDRYSQMNVELRFRYGLIETSQWSIVSQYETSEHPGLKVAQSLTPAQT